MSVYMNRRKRPAREPIEQARAARQAPDDVAIYRAVRDDPEVQALPARSRSRLLQWIMQDGLAVTIDKMKMAPGTGNAEGIAILERIERGDLPPGSEVQRRGPGRPRWDKALLRSRYDEARRATEPPVTPGSIAANFRRLDGTRGIEPDSLARLLRQHGIRVG